MSTFLATAVEAAASVLGTSAGREQVHQKASQPLLWGCRHVAAGIVALVGKRQIQQVTPTPDRTVENVKLDVQEVK